MIDAALASMPAQRPGAGPAVVGRRRRQRERVPQRVAYLETLMAERFGTAGRTIALVNHPDSRAHAPSARHPAEPAPRAVRDRRGDGSGQTRCSHHHARRPEVRTERGHARSFRPRSSRPHCKALDAADIPARIVVSACYPAASCPLRDRTIDDGRAPRPAIVRCGDSTPAYFGRACWWRA